MSDHTPPHVLADARERFLSLVAEVRPELHRYCARLTGSVIDGEDVVQDALARAFYAMSLQTEMPNLRPWLFRIAHNAAVDHLRRYEKRHVEARADFDDVPSDVLAQDPEAVRAALTSFLDLPVSQRSAVILKDVLGQSLEETAETLGTTVLAVKALLHRGRAALRAKRDAPPETAPALDAEERARLESYVAAFNAGDWDALKARIGSECRLDLVSKAERRGAGIHGYFGRYASEPNVRLALGAVEGKPALLVFDAPTAERPAYFVLLGHEGGALRTIRDYRYVPYIARDLRFTVDCRSSS